jgi:hypothetical protein
VNRAARPARSKGNHSGGPKVNIPEREGVQLVHVAAIAALGFVIGVIWPRLAGVSLVPAVPVEGAQGAYGPSPSASQEGVAEAPKVTPAPAAAPEVTEPRGPRIEVGDAQVTSCRDAVGKELKECGTLEVDALVKERLRALAACPGASGISGKLSMGLELDLAKGRVIDVRSGRTTDLPQATTKQLLECAKNDFEKVSLAKVKGDHDRYTVFYPVEFVLPEEKSASADVVAASGQATVRWNAALIRKSPETAAEVRTRLLSGTRVVVTGRKGEWYRVKYDAKGREGWVHGAAIGL